MKCNPRITTIGDRTVDDGSDSHKHGPNPLEAQTLIQLMFLTDRLRDFC